jgi:triacylglycerol lipase
MCRVARLWFSADSPFHRYHSMFTRSHVKSIPFWPIPHPTTSRSHSTGSVKERAEQMHAYLNDNLPKGTGVNFVAHSMGGLDCRYLISNLKPTSYTPLSLTTIGTPHRGSPFMDWCAANIGVGGSNYQAVEKATKNLPFSLKSPLLAAAAAKDTAENIGWTTGLTKYLLNIFDSPAYSNLTTQFLRDFNPQNPDSPSVKYTSVAGRCRKMSVLHPLWFPKLVLDAAADKGYPEDGGKAGKEYEGNDGLVSVSSARWGEFLGVVDDCHHWELRGEGGLWPNGGISSDKPQGKPDGSKPGGWDWQGGIGQELGLDGPGGIKAGVTKKVGKNEKEKTSSSWDLAQVGQVVDWVTDLLPGEARTGTGKKQMAEATREKEKEEARGKGEAEKKKKKEKFDLARFYGGLMLKLREDGL